MEMPDRFCRPGETKQQAAARLQSDLRQEFVPPHRDLRREAALKEFASLLGALTDPEKPLDDVDHLEWLRVLIAGGKPFEEFSGNVREFDDATACGLVWTANFVAYRCRTCGITPCMSICAECFHGGNHEGHDFNMFRSLAGGACDCGDPSVMRPCGFCHRHAGDQPQPKEPPLSLMLMAKQIVPALFTRLLLHMRLNYFQGPSRSADVFLSAMREADSFLDLLHDLCKMGGAMRRILTAALMDKDHYSNILQDTKSHPSSKTRSQEQYYKALNSLPSPHQNIVIGSTTYPGIVKDISHATLLEELLFWTVIYRFPQKMVTFLLNMLPDNDYKELFTRSFVQHYGCIAMSLAEEQSPNLLANRVVHISVQLFSNEDLAVRMADDMRLLEVIIKCALNQIMKTVIACPMSAVSSEGPNTHKVVNCDNKLLKGQCYWPIISDLTNIISHRSVAERFFTSLDLMTLWARFLRYFMGMNLNLRELNQHVEFESNLYSAAFSAEIEACAAPMWQMAVHCKDPKTSSFTLGMLGACLTELCHWLTDCALPKNLNTLQVSFHLPLLRYFTIFLSQAINLQGLEFDKLNLDTSLLMKLMEFPLQIQAKLSEILCGMWVRNGVQMKCQAMTYLQCHFCASMGDLDLYFIQVCASLLDPDYVVEAIFRRYQVLDWLSVDINKRSRCLETERVMSMLEGALQHIAMLVSIRTHLGMSERDLMREEMVSLLCMQDRTHSHLQDKIPEKTGLVNASSHFEELLKEVADYRDPMTELDGVQQGQYSPKASVWMEEFDPLRTMLRSMQRKDYQGAIDRYTDHVKQTGRYKGATHPWPLYRPLQPIKPIYQGLRRILHSRILHAAIFSILYRALEDKNTSDTVLCLCVALLNMAAQCSADYPVGDCSGESPPCVPVDKDLSTWYQSSSLPANLTKVLETVKVVPAPQTKESPSVLLGDADTMLQQLLHQEITSILGTPAVNVMDVVAQQQQHANDVDMAEDDTEDEDDDDEDDDDEEGMSEEEVLEAAGGGFPDNQVVHEGGQSVQSAIDTVMQQVVHQGLALHAGQEAAIEHAQQHPEAAHLYGALRRRLKNVARLPSPELRASVDMPIGESLLSLLVKLHAKMSGREGSYVPPSKRTGRPEEQSGFGTGPFYIQSLLDQFCSMDQTSCQAIETICHMQDQDQGQASSQSPSDSAAERRRKAREAQKKLVAKFASQQMKFMEQALEKEDVHDEMDSAGASESCDQTLAEPEKEYECVICGQTNPSTDTKPIGVMVLMQPSNVLGHRCVNDERRQLPVGGDPTLTSLGRCWREEMQRLTTADKHFTKEKAWEMLSTGWEGGVHIQTCGHAIHLDCHKAYLNSLGRAHYHAHDLDVRRRGEFQCPLCRQLANSVLPFVPLKPPKPSSLERKSTLLMRVAYLLNVGKKTQADPVVSPEQSTAIQTFVSDLWRENESDELEAMKSSPDGLFPSVCSIARMNLELEIVCAGGSLANHSTTAHKRSCMKPLLQILEIYAREINRRPDIVKVWSKLINGSTPTSSAPALPSVTENDVPLLVCDPAALLLLLVFSIRQPIDRVVYQCVVSSLYNLVYIQALGMLSCRLPESERRAWQSSGKPGKEEKEASMARLLSDVITRFSQINLYQHPDFVSCGSYQLFQAIWSPQTVEDALEHHCLPWLRLASLLQHYLFDEELPVHKTSDEEFQVLAQFLCLIDSDQAQRSGKPSHLSAQCFRPPPKKDASSVIATLCKPFCDFVKKDLSPAKDLLIASPTFSLPRLLQLPPEYNSVFQRYNQQTCDSCKKRPERPLVCLVCGKLVCWGSSCCKGQSSSREVGEGILHAHYCGKGTAVYLDVNSSATLLIRGERKCSWASLYLDSHGEEDIDLRRGKPLYMCEQRHSLLERLWRSHALDHNCKRWEWHHGGLDRRRAFPLSLFN